MLFSDRAIELCLTLKMVFGLALGVGREPAQAGRSGLADLDWPVPDYTPLCRRRQRLTVALDGRANAGGLHLPVDGTGIEMMGEMGLQGMIHGKPVRTTISDKAAPCPLDHVNERPMAA